MEYLKDIQELERARKRLDEMTKRYHADGNQPHADNFEEIAIKISYAITDIKMMLGIKTASTFDDDIPF